MECHQLSRQGGALCADRVPEDQASAGTPAGYSGRHTSKALVKALATHLCLAVSSCKTSGLVLHVGLYFIQHDGTAMMGGSADPQPQACKGALHEGWALTSSSTDVCKANVGRRDCTLCSAACNGANGKLGQGYVEPCHVMSAPLLSRHCSAGLLTAAQSSYLEGAFRFCCVRSCKLSNFAQCKPPANEFCFWRVAGYSNSIRLAATWPDAVVSLPCVAHIHVHPGVGSVVNVTHDHAAGS